MLEAITRLFKGYGFHRQTPVTGLDILEANYQAWEQHKFFTEVENKSRRLAEIARQRNAIKDEIAKAMRQKKSTSPMYHALRALKAEELKIEGQR